MVDNIVRCPYVLNSLDIPEGTCGITLFRGVLNRSSDVILVSENNSHDELAGMVVGESVQQII